MATFFTSDLHFGHKRIIQLCNRPFADVDEMDDALVKNWNDTVTAKDTVYLLGDVSFRNRATTRILLSRLNGNILLVRGNHDKSLKGPDLDRFGWVKDLYTAKIEDPDAPDGERRIVLCHFPLLVWENSHHGTWHLHGHCHGNLKPDPNALRMDVGVDPQGYFPCSYVEIADHMSEATWKPLDHHGAD